MIKQVTCGLSTIKRAAEDKGIGLAVDGWYEYGDRGRVDHGTPDVHARTLPSGELAVEASTLAGQLFLSLLVCGAIG